MVFKLGCGMDIAGCFEIDECVLFLNQKVKVQI
jgi:hypothetical protein